MKKQWKVKRVAPKKAKRTVKDAQWLTGKSRQVRSLVARQERKTTTKLSIARYNVTARWGDTTYLGAGTALNGIGWCPDPNSVAPTGWLQGTPVPDLQTGGAGTGAYTQIGSTLCFKLTDVPNYASWCSKFDQYRIKAVKCKFTHDTGQATSNLYTAITAAVSPISSTGNLANGQGVAVVASPVLQYAVDTDGSVTNTVPSGPSYVRMYPNAQMHHFGVKKVCEIDIVPRVASNVYKTSGTNVGFEESKPDVWIDTGNPDVEHYGLVMWWQQLLQGNYIPTALNGVLNGPATLFWCDLEYVLEFKGVIG